MGNIFNFDMSSFSPKLIAAIVYTVAALFAFALFPTFNGAAQGWHLEARQDGACETKSGTRFDRVLPLAANTAASVFLGKGGEYNDPNKYDWGKGLTVTQDGTAGTCHITSAFTAETDGYYGVNKLLSADGTVVSGVVAATGAIAANADLTNGATWERPASMFNDNRAIINIIIGATVLIIGIGPIMILGGVGLYLLNTFSGGMTGPTKFLVGTLGAIVAVTLLGSFTDFISISYDAMDPDRFTMYEHSIASLAGTIKQFWGLIFAAGWVGLGGYFGWQAFQNYRGSRSSGGGSDSQVLG